MAFAFTMLLTALILSVVAAYYSIIGLTAIFSAAVIPIIIMGASLELGKVMATVWLHNNWQRASWKFKSYLIPAVVFLMLLTSMGIFGFLSKAHSDQSLVSGDVQSKIAIYDEKIKTARENIEANRKQLKQMDEAVDQVMGRSTDEKGADKAVSVRRNQSRDRVALAKDIEANQKLIATLNDQAAPIRAEVRKVEAEVGPIKYIAAFIYGSNPDANILEKAVTWVIIIIVSVFDPLAVILLLASQYSFQWFRKAREEDELELLHNTVPAHIQKVVVTPDPVIQTLAANDEINDTVIEDVVEPSDPELAPCYKCGTPLVLAPGIGQFCPNKECDVFDGPFAEDEEAPQIQINLDFNKPVKPEEEPIVIEHIELDSIDEEIIEDSNENDTVDIIEAKRLWKEANPEDSLKHQRRLFEAGISTQLPWEVEPFLKKKNLTYLEKVGKQQIKKEISED